MRKILEEGKGSFAMSLESGGPLPPPPPPPEPPGPSGGPWLLLGELGSEPPPGGLEPERE